MIKTETVAALPSVTLHRIRVNRGESGSPNWKAMYYLTQEDASTALGFELPENRHKEGVVPVCALYDESRDAYYIAKA